MTKKLMDYTADQKDLLERVNEIGIGIGPSSENDFIFVALSPYLDKLMALLKCLNQIEMQTLFIQYEGVMKVMRMIENEAKQIEADLGR